MFCLSPPSYKNPPLHFVLFRAFTLPIKIFLYSVFKMSPKRQFIYLKEARKLTKLKKIEARNKTLVENISFLFKDKSIEGS